MSTFTSRSAMHEIPRQFFSALKSHAFNRLRYLANTEHEWSTITQAIQDWDQSARVAEVSEVRWEGRRLKNAVFTKVTFLGQLSKKREIHRKKKAFWSVFGQEKNKKDSFYP